MFSMGNAEPRPYSSTLDRAGMSWVVVTSTFTQLGLEATKTFLFFDKLKVTKPKNKMSSDDVVQLVAFLTR